MDYLDYERLNKVADTCADEIAEKISDGFDALDSTHRDINENLEKIGSTLADILETLKDLLHKSA